MAQVKFYLDKHKNKDGSIIETNVPIFLFYSFNGQRLKYFTGERTDSKNYNAEYWKGKKDPIKKTAPKADLINRNLNSLRLHVETIHSDAKALGILPDADFFRKKLNELLKGEVVNKEITVLQALKLFLKMTKADKANNTYRNAKSAVNHITKFISNKKLTFSEVDGRFVDGFRTYLINEGHLNNTVAKYLRILRTFFNWAKDEAQGYFPNFNFKIRVLENDIDVIFLNYEQVMTLYNLELQSPALSRVRDVFVFGCFTGMRFGDIAKMKHTDVEEHQIKFRIQKAGKTISHTVPLAPIAKAILNKYKDLPGEKALPVISNQRFNESVKEVCKAAGLNDLVTIAEKAGDGKITETQYELWELITAHVCRKTFITISLMLGMPESVTKSITGHSKNSRAFTRYYDIVDSHKQAEMIKIFGNE